MPACLTPTDFEGLENARLDEGERKRLLRHLDVCDDCRRAHDEFRRAGVLIAKARRVADNLTGTFTPSGGAGGGGADAGLRGLDERHLPRVEGYRILSVLGQGGMGIVYRAEQTRLNRTVALKVLPAVVGAANPQSVARFRREATAAARLHHTNIIPIYDFGESHHAYYYAMELIDGQPLNHVIAAFATEDATTATAARFVELLSKIIPNFAPVTPQADPERTLAPPSDHSRFPSASTSGRGRVYYRQVARWMADAADALAYAHGEGIIHRDIKPANFILSTDGRIMIADFGLALVIGEDSMTVTGSLMGTLRYMSPEQAMGKRMGIDHRTDIWSLGAVMFELLTFQPPFTGLDQKEVLSNIMTHEPAPPHKVNPAVPRDLEVICLKALEKSQAARFPTARAMAEELRRYLGDLPITTRPRGPLGRAIRFVRRNKFAATVLVALVLFGASATWVIHRWRVVSAREVHVKKYIELRDKEPIAAKQALLEALRIDPNHTPSLFNLADVKRREFHALPEHLRTDRTLIHEADGLCRRARANSPGRRDENFARGLNTHGVILKILDRYDEAVQTYSLAAELDPRSATTRNNLGLVQAMRGDYVVAEEHVRKACGLAGTDRPDAAQYWRNLAVLQQHLSEPDAGHSMQRALACAPNDVTCLLIDARMRCSAASIPVSEAARIAAELARAERLAGGDLPRLRRMQALAMLRSQQWPRAVELATQAIESGDMQCVNEFIVAIAQARDGEMAAARAAFQRALENRPDKLKGEGAVHVATDRGFLWMDTAAELNALRDEASGLVQSTSP